MEMNSRHTRSRWKRRLATAVVVAGLLVLTLIATIVWAAWPVLGERWDQARVDASVALIESKIFPALEAHRARVGRYPQKLSGLVPGELASLPVLPVGKLVYTTNTVPPLGSDGKPTWVHYFEIHLVSRSYPGYWFSFVRTSRHLIYVSAEGRWRAENSF